MNRKHFLFAGLALLIGLLLVWILGPFGDSADSGTASREPGPREGLVIPGGSAPTSLAGSLAGRVSSSSGEGVAGARVCARASSPELESEDQHDMNCVLTSPAGTFEFSGLQPARYRLGASARGFLASGYQEEVEGETVDFVRLASGEKRADIDIALEQGGVELKGLVKDIGGGIVAGAWVSVRERGSWRFGRVNRSASPAVTQSEDDGSFSVWVKEGTVRASAKAPGYGQGEASGSAPGNRIEIIMTPESVLAGRVVEADSGKPVADVSVTANAGFFERGGSARTDADGAFRITRLAPGRYKPSAEARGAYGVAGESILLGLGQTREGVLIKLHPAAYVSGTITLDDEQGRCVDGSVSLTDDTGQGSVWAGQDEDREKVEFKAVLPGSYSVSVRCEGYVSRDEYPDIVVGAEDLIDLQWSVSPGLQLTGSVKTSDGQPVADAQVRARRVGGDPRAQRTGGQADTDEKGDFEVEGLLEGEYSVSASAEGYVSAEEPSKTSIRSGDTGAVELVVTAGGAIQGVVVDEAGTPIVAPTLRAAGLTRGRRGGNGAIAGDDGSFEIAGLEAGRYRVIARSKTGQSLRVAGTGDDDVQGVEAEVFVGKTTKVRLVVERQDNSIEGVVVDEEGVPVSDAFVDYQRQSESAGAAKSGAMRRVRWGRWDSELTLTDMDGRFQVTGLSPGTYTLLAYRKGGGEALKEDVEVGSDTRLTILSTGSLSGRTLLSSGGQPAKFTISVSDKVTGFSRDEEFYRTEGQWSLGDLPAGTYDVQVQAREGTSVVEGIALREGEDKSGIELMLEERATISGQLVSLESGEPVAGMRVSVSSAAGGGFSFSMRGGDKERITDDEGRFTVEDAPAGQVSLMGMPTNWRESEHGWMRYRTSVEAGTETDIGQLRVPKRRVGRGERAGELGYTTHEREAGTELEDVEWKVALVRPDGPAKAAGLALGDVIVEIDGHDVTGTNSYLYWSLSQVKVGTRLKLKLAGGRTIEIVAAPPR